MSLIIILSDDKDFLDLNNKNIRIVSFLDFKRKQDPFYAHLEKVIKDYEKSEIYKLGCYINLKARSEEGKQSFILDEHILNWAASSGEIIQTIVLGDYGTGKTTTSKRIFWTQAKRYLKNPSSNRVPIFIKLQEYNNKHIDQRTFIERALSEMAENKQLTYQKIQDFNRQGKLLWILDGFDEMVTCVNINLIKKNFTEILKLVQSQSRLILTSRTHFFKTKDELTDTLKGTELYDQLRQEIQFQVLFVEPFTKEDINKYVQIRLKDDAEEFLNVIYDNSQLEDLASRPILLEMIIKTLPKMIESEVKLNLPNLYDQYTRIWLDRDIARTNMTTDERVIFCQNLAWYFFTEDKYEIHYAELPQFILAQFPDEISIKYKREFLEYDVQTTTFLHRDDAGNYSFTHKSFLEFFVASYIFKQLNEGNTEALKMKVIPHEIQNFLGGMLENSPNLLEKVEAISQSNKFSLKYFFKRFLKPRLFPLIRKKSATDYIHRSYSRHLLMHLGTPSIIFLLVLSFYIFMKYPEAEHILFPIMPVLFIGVVLLMIFIYFVDYLFLTFSGKTGDPIINFNSLSLCHFAGKKIDTNILKQRKSQLDINQEGIADLTIKVILGLPLEEKDEDKISDNEYDEKTKSSNVQSLNYPAHF